MSSVKIVLLSVIAFAVPVAITASYHLQTSRTDAPQSQSPPKGKVLFFTSPS